MNCKQVREYLLDLDAGQAPAAAEEHVRCCTACAAELSGLRQTMSLLDEWSVPEPSPYFDSRLRARLREEAAVRVSWWEALRKPAMALAFTLILAGTVMIHGGRSVKAPANVATVDTRMVAQPQPGTAVGDLQYLDRNHELLATFDVLDNISDQGDQANP